VQLHYHWSKDREGAGAETLNGLGGGVSNKFNNFQTLSIKLVIK
jgi:hypothetical protein